MLQQGSFPTWLMITISGTGKRRNLLKILSASFYWILSGSVKQKEYFFFPPAFSRLALSIPREARLADFQKNYSELLCTKQSSRYGLLTLTEFPSICHFLWFAPWMSEVCYPQIYSIFSSWNFNNNSIIAKKDGMTEIKTSYIYLRIQYRTTLCLSDYTTEMQGKNIPNSQQGKVFILFTVRVFSAWNSIWKSKCYVNNNKKI